MKSPAPLDSTAGVLIPATATGVHLGPSQAGMLSLRLLRPSGTRAVVHAEPEVARLITLRAAVAGTSVRVATTEPAAWQPILRHGIDAHVVTPPAPPARAGGRPTLTVDHPTDPAAALGHTAEWHCTLSVRPLRYDAAPVTPYATAGADIAIYGMLRDDLARAVTEVYDLGAHATATLTTVPPQSVAVITRGQLRLVRLEPTDGERRVLRGATAPPSPAPAAPGRHSLPPPRPLG